jgi:hypothetical protein
MNLSSRKLVWQLSIFFFFGSNETVALDDSLSLGSWMASLSSAERRKRSIAIGLSISSAVVCALTNQSFHISVACSHV